jgi:hypothetical protein
VVLAFHVGNEISHVDELWERQVSLDFVLHDTSTVVRALEGVGFRVIEAREREPYPEVEHQSRRAYLQAVRDADD